MNMTTRGALNAYAKVEVEAGISNASPHKLILMLFEGALTALAAARVNMLLKNVAQKGQAISKAIAIIDEGLKVSLDEKAGGELAQNLKALYEYMCHRLLLANLHNNIPALDEVSKLLTDLKGAWEAIAPHAQVAQPAVAQQSPPQRAAMSYGKA
jgi:flagellar protein FliS